MRLKVSFAALVLVGSFGCGPLRLTPVGTNGPSVGAGFGVGADVAVRRPATFPNLTFAPVGDAKEIIAIHPCRRSAENDVLSAANPVCASLAVGNFGFGANEDAFEVVIYLDGALADTWVIVDPIRPKEIVRRSDFEFGPLSPGLHTLHAVIDPSNRVGETDESDNEAAAEIFIYEAP